MGRSIFCLYPPLWKAPRFAKKIPPISPGIPVSSIGGGGGTDKKWNGPIELCDKICHQHIRDDDISYREEEFDQEGS